MYNKLFTKILDSSIWLESDSTRIVWMTFIASMDESGFCQFASLANLARRAVVSLRAAGLAVEKLEAPDPNSSDPEHEGRRIQRVAGGWLVLNAPKYRELVTRANAQEKTRERVRRFREKWRNGDVTPVTPSNDSVTLSEAVSEADTEADTETKKTSARRAPRDEPIFEKAYRQYPRHVGIRAAEKAWNTATGRLRKDYTEITPENLTQVEDFLYQRVMEFSAVCKRINKAREYIPHMATWLNQDRFLDDPTEWAAGAGSNGNSTSKAEQLRTDNRAAIVSAALGASVRGGDGHHRPTVETDAIPARGRAAAAGASAGPVAGQPERPKPVPDA